MYIEQVESSANKNGDKSREDSGSADGELVDYADQSKLVQSTSINFSIQSNEMDSTKMCDKNSIDASLAGEKITPAEFSSIDTRLLDPRLARNPRETMVRTNEMCDDKPVVCGIVDCKSNNNGFNENELKDGNIEAMIREDPGDFFDSDNEDESAGLFTNKLKSIFIRKTRNDDNGAESARSGKVLELQNPVKSIARKNEILPTKLRKKHAISFVDTLITLFVVAPMVIGHWRGIWNMMDIYGEYFPEWPCFILGICLHLLFAIMRDRFHGRFVEKWRTHNAVGRVAYDMVRLAYIYIFALACNAHWRGGWMIFSRYFGKNIWLSTFFTLLFITGLVTLRAFRNLLAPPFIVIIDRPDHVFKFPTRYNVNTRDWSLYILDCAFSVGVVGSLVVFVWRGVWVLFDLHLFPENREYSAIGSLVIGYIIVAVTFCLQPLMRYTCARLEGLARLLAADAFLLLSFLGTVNVWRGIWSVLDLWLLPDDLELSCWITHVGCFVFLVLLNCSNSILVRGVYIDAEEEEGRCVVFPCHYLRLFFKIERQKKEARRQNLVATSKEAQSRNEGNAKEVENETLLNCTNAMPTIIPANPESLV